MAGVGEPNRRGETRSAREVMTQRTHGLFEMVVVADSQIAAATTGPPSERRCIERIHDVAWSECTRVMARRPLPSRST